MADIVDRVISAGTGMPCRPLGNTGMRVGLFPLGGQGALETDTRRDEHLDIIQMAYDLGVNYFDTSPIYGISQELYGEVIPSFRDEIYLATKTEERGRDDAMRDIEKSLETLGTDWIDLLQIHHLDRVEEVDRVMDDDGALAAIEELRDAVIAAVDNLDQLRFNISAAKSFVPMLEEECRGLERLAAGYVRRGAFFRKEFGNYGSKDELSPPIKIL